MPTPTSAETIRRPMLALGGSGTALTAMAASFLAVVIARNADADVILGGQRPTTLHVPAVYDPEVPTPLLISLHGCPSDSDGPFGDNLLRFEPLAEELGILFAAPDGTGAPGQRSWGECSGSFAVNSAYLKALIEEAQGQFNVDPDRIFVTGYSDGGFMALRMACDHPDLIAAVAYLAGSSLEDCWPASPVPVLDVHGTADSIVPYRSGVAALERWVEGYWPMEAVEAGPGPELVAGAPTTIIRWGDDCVPDGPAELWSMAGANHFASRLIADGQTTRFARHATEWLLDHPRREAPVARLVVSPVSGVVPLEVTCAAGESMSPEGTNIASYCWAFGATEVRGDAAVSHVFDRPGRSGVRLAVVTDDRRVSTTSSDVLALCPDGELGPWTSATVGAVDYPSAARFEGEVGMSDLLLCAAGDGALRRNDKLFFVFREILGTFRLTARVSELEADAAGSMVGLMCRTSLSDAAGFAAVQIETSGSTLDQGARFRFRHRLEEGSRVRTESGDTVTSASGWLRIERCGDTFRGLSSEDGEVWNVVGEKRIEGTPPTMLLGVAAGRGNTSSSSFYEATRARVRLGEVGLALDGCNDPERADFRRGDCNDDGAVNISDATCILNWLFAGEADPGCVASTNTNSDDAANITDATYLLNHLFAGGPPPAAPFPDCGPGALVAELSCENPSCP